MSCFSRVLVVLLIMAFAPPVRATATSVEPVVLANGLRVRIVEDHSQPRVAAVLAFHSGYAHDPASHPELAHVAEHLMFEWRGVNGASYLQQLEALGADEYVGSTSAESTFFGAQVPTQALESLLWLEAMRAAFMIEQVNERTLERAAEAVLDESRSRGLMRLAHLELASLAGLHPSPSGGWSRDDLALPAYKPGELQAFMQRQYVMQNASLVVVGDINPEAALQYVVAAFGRLRGGPPLRLPNAHPLREARPGAESVIRGPMTGPLYVRGYPLTGSERELARWILRAFDRAAEKTNTRSVWRSGLDRYAEGSLVVLRASVTDGSSRQGLRREADTIVARACSVENLREAVQSERVASAMRAQDFLQSARELASKGTLPARDVELNRLSRTCRESVLQRPPVGVWLRPPLLNPLYDPSQKGSWF